MANKRRTNWIQGTAEVPIWERSGISLNDAKVLFLKDIRGLAPQTQRWHKENMNALEKILQKQGIEVSDCNMLTAEFLKCTFTGFRDYTLMLLLLETGIRIQECLDIQLSDIRMKDGQILIHGKGAKQRIVPFQSKMKKVLLKRI